MNLNDITQEDLLNRRSLIDGRILRYDNNSDFSFVLKLLENTLHKNEASDISNQIHLIISDCLLFEGGSANCFVKNGMPGQNMGEIYFDRSDTALDPLQSRNTFFSIARKKIKVFTSVRRNAVRFESSKTTLQLSKNESIEIIRQRKRENAQEIENFLMKIMLQTSKKI